MIATVIYLSPTGEAAVEFVEGDQRVTFRYQTDGTIASLRPFVLQTAAQLAKAKDLTEGAVIDLTPDPIQPPKEPDPKDLERQDFVLLVQTLKKTEAAFKLELATQKDLDDAAVAVKTAFQPGFEDLL